MAHVTFAASIQRHLTVPDTQVSGSTLREVLETVFARSEGLRNYLLDDQGALRKHLAVFVDGVQIDDREGLSDAVEPQARVHVIQALSGG